VQVGWGGEGPRGRAGRGQGRDCSQLWTEAVRLRHCLFFYLKLTRALPASCIESVPVLSDDRDSRECGSHKLISAHHIVRLTRKDTTPGGARDSGTKKPPRLSHRGFGAGVRGACLYVG
jgi:hypothetical protein